MMKAQEPRGGDVRMVIGLDRIDPASLHLGDSICVQGCCLTVTELMAQARGKTPQEIGYYRLRAPVKPITLAELAAVPKTEDDIKAVVRG